MKKFIVMLAIVGLLCVGCFEGGGGGGSDAVFVPAPEPIVQPIDHPEPVVEPEPDDQDYTPVEPDGPYDVFEGATMIQGPYADYNKTFVNDSMMCWAVATCNALENAGWATTTDWCMYEMIDRFDDVPGYVDNAILYWFEEVSGMSYVPAYVAHGTTEALNFFITETQDFGLPVILVLGSTTWTVGHALTGYGFKGLDPNRDHGQMFAFKMTDGDDRYSGVVDWVFYYNDNTGRWECFDRDFYIASAYSIDRIVSGSTRSVRTYPTITRSDVIVGK